MIYSYYVELNVLPLTANGKVNKRALPDPQNGLQSDYAYEGPRNKLEAQLIEIWRDVLHLELLGIHDDFFLLGGHSLKAMLLVSRILKEYRLEAPLKQLFAYPTIAGLAHWMASAQEKETYSIEPAARKEEYLASPVQNRIYALTKMDKDSTTYNMPNIMMADGEIDRDRLEKSFVRLMERHEALRTSFEMRGEQVVQIIHDQVAFSVKERHVEEALLPELIEDFIQPFLLNEAPLLRVQLFSLNSGKRGLMFDIHHIISDGISTGVLLRELMDIYSGEELAAPRIQYKDYSEWQRQYNDSEEIKQQELFWKEQLQGELPNLHMPTDFMRPSVFSFKGDSIDFAIDPSLTLKLKQLSRETGSTLYMVLLAAYTILLSKYTGQEDIIVGSVSMGRPHPDIEQTLGMFVNTVAHRNFPEGARTVRDFLQEVKDRSLDVFEHQHYPCLAP